MADLLQSARLFEVGTRLQTASSSLMEVARGGKPEHDALKWAGDFLARVDWTSDIKTEESIDGGLAVSAANTRPKFYASLVKIGPKFQKMGMGSERQVCEFLKAVYRCLQSGGTETGEMKSEYFTLASELLHLLSESIMVDLCNNGLPRRESVLTIGEAIA